MKQIKKKKKSPNKRKTPRAPTIRPSWVDELSFEPVQEQSCSTDSASNNNNNNNTSCTLSVVSWNVLAQAYCSRRSQTHLPHYYQVKVFHPSARRKRITEILLSLFVEEQQVDVICLQEVDMDEIGVALRSVGYAGLETPRTAGGGAGGRTDACAIYVNSARWSLEQHELVRLDDLATRTADSEGQGDDGDTDTPSSTSSSNGNGNHDSRNAIGNLQGLQQSFLRRNAALIVRLRENQTGRTVVIANAHLYWHPGYEYVKLCQVHYILQRAKDFCQPNEPIVFCGDLNSRPHSFTHSYLARGSVNAKHVAPWYHYYDSDQDDSWHPDTDSNDNGDATSLADRIANLQLTQQHATPTEPPRVRYLLDSTLNKLCRWLRILGVDTALETEEEEKARTGQGRMLLFNRCREERRTLVTTSTRLLHRRDCPPGGYCISPALLPSLEVILVHMLLTHGVVLVPKTFLTRCVVCNGMICNVTDSSEKRRIMQDYQAPSGLSEEMEVYECNGCKQGYWWCDRPTSSASRVKTAATRLFEICLRAGVPIKGETPHMFAFVDIEAERSKGWDYTDKGSELLKQKLDVIGWLKDEYLVCPFDLTSAYALKDNKGTVIGERLPFTNVTSSFVNTLDYIFFDRKYFVITELLDIPTSFPQLNDDGEGVMNGHLLPSDVWPSDHLAIGARFTFTAMENEKEASPQLLSLPTTLNEKEASPQLFCLPTENGQMPPPPPPPQSANLHRRKCDCGCVPQIKSLFEMAELRKQARLAKQANDST